MNSFYITCTLAAVQRKRGTSIYPLKNPTAPPPPPTSPEKEVTRKKVSVSAPNPLKLCLWIQLKRVDSLSRLFPAFLYFEYRLWIRIRIRKSVVRIRGSGFVPKCHGSTTMAQTRYDKKFLWYRYLSSQCVAWGCRSAERGAADRLTHKSCAHPRPPLLGSKNI